MLEPAGKIGHVIASPIQQQYNFLLLEKVSKMVCLLNSCEVADFWILSCAAGIYVIVCSKDRGRAVQSIPPKDRNGGLFSAKVGRHLAVGCNGQFYLLQDGHNCLKKITF